MMALAHVVGDKASVEQMRQHVLCICQNEDIVFSWCRRPAQAWSVNEFEEICIPPIRSAISYATALHEIGHIKGRYQRSRSAMVRERWAWHWARANALIWTPATERNAYDALTRYAARA